MDDNYIVIKKWMTSKLNLSGNELLVYALIYGFSQDGISEYYGGRNYISNLLNMSMSTVDRSLRNLIKKGYIIKTSGLVNNIYFNHYRCSHFD